jgi:predicted O-methyltransferase YrrM
VNHPSADRVGNDHGPEVIDRRLRGVEGWFNLDEAHALYEAVRNRPPRQTPLTVVEIGSWKGRSTITLASALEARGEGGVVFAIDPHTGSVEHHRRWGAVDTFAEFKANIERAGVSSFVEPLRMTSHDAVERFSDGSVDVLFIDGSHEYEDVLRDCDDWFVKLAPGALVGFNDTSWPGVYRVMRERVTTRGTPFRRPVLVRSTLYVDFDPTAAWTKEEAARWRALRGSLLVRRISHRLVPLLPAPMKRLGNEITRRMTSR